SYFRMAPIEILKEMRRAVEAGRAVHGFAYYPKDSTEEAVDGGVLLVHYGAIERDESGWLEIGRKPENEKVGREVAEALKRHGLAVVWDGDDEHCIEVNLDWKRRGHLEV